MSETHFVKLYLSSHTSTEGRGRAMSPAAAAADDDDDVNDDDDDGGAMT